MRRADPHRAQARRRMAAHHLEAGRGVRSRQPRSPPGPRAPAALAAGLLGYHPARPRARHPSDRAVVLASGAKGLCPDGGPVLLDTRAAPGQTKAVATRAQLSARGRRKYGLGITPSWRTANYAHPTGVGAARGKRPSYPIAPRYVHAALSRAAQRGTASSTRQIRSALTKRYGSVDAALAAARRSSTTRRSSSSSSTTRRSSTGRRRTGGTSTSRSRRS